MALLLWALIGTALGAVAQNDTLFPNVSGTWDVTHYDYHDPWNNGNWPSEELHFTFQAEPAVEEDGRSWGTLFLNEQVNGLIAVDSGRVYFRAVSGPTLQLYDFGLDIGDTAHFEDGIQELPVVVTDIDSVWLGTKLRRHLTLSNMDEWIAGMGSNRGVLRPLWSFFEDSYELTQFCGSFVDSVGTPYTSCWSISMGLAERSNALLQVYPNPSDGTIFLTGTDQGTVYRVFDEQGREVLRGRTAQERTTIQLPQAVPGLYLLDVAGKRSKFVVDR